MKKSTVVIGRYGEELVKKYFLNKNCHLIAQNLYLKHTEIDLVFYDPLKNYLFFIEVKTRHQYYAIETVLSPLKRFRFLTGSASLLRKYRKKMFIKQFRCLLIFVYSTKPFKFMTTVVE